MSLNGAGYCEESPIVVRAGDVCYRADMIQKEIDAIKQSYSENVPEMTDEACEDIVQNVISRYTIQALTKLRLKDLHKDQPDENTQYELRAQAQAKYEQYWQSLRRTDTSNHLTDEQITQMLVENGVTLDLVYQEAVDNWQIQTLLEYYDVDTSVSDEDIQNYYMDVYVKPCQERYADNVPLFEEEVLYGGGSSAYAPEGYRLLFQIVIPIPEDMQAEMDALNAEAEAHAKTAEEAYSKIADMAIAGEDITELRNVYKTEMDAIDQIQVKFGEIWESIPGAVQDTTDEIYARLAQGETFESLLGDNPESKSLMYHHDSIVWPTELKKAADKLEKPGDISLPALTSEGVHILYYDQDAPSGAVELNDTNLAAVRYELEQGLLLSKLNNLVEPWKEEYGLTVDMSSIHY